MRRTYVFFLCHVIGRWAVSSAGGRWGLREIYIFSRSIFLKLSSLEVFGVFALVTLMVLQVLQFLL